MNFEKKEILPLTKKQERKYKKKQKICHIYKQEFHYMSNKDDNCCRVRGHCHCTRKFKDDIHSTGHPRNNILKEILVVFYKGSDYDYHFIIKKLAE